MKRNYHYRKRPCRCRHLLYRLQMRQHGLPFPASSGLDPVSGELPASFEAQCRQAFRNVFAIVKAAGGTPADIVRQTVYLTDLDNFGVVNKVMSEIFSAPYPARSCVQISALPKGGLIEVEATVVLD